MVVPPANPDEAGSAEVSASVVSSASVVDAVAAGVDVIDGAGAVAVAADREPKLGLTGASGGEG